MATTLAEERVLVHADLNPKNVLLRRDGGRWRLAALTGWAQDHQGTDQQRAPGAAAAGAPPEITWHGMLHTVGFVLASGMLVGCLVLAPASPCYGGGDRSPGASRRS